MQVKNLLKSKELPLLAQTEKHPVEFSVYSCAYLGTESAKSFFCCCCFDLMVLRGPNSKIMKVKTYSLNPITLQK